MSRSTLLYINGLTVEVCIHRLRLKLDNVNLGDLEISRSAFLGKTTHGLLGGIGRCIRIIPMAAEIISSSGMSPCTAPSWAWVSSFRGLIIRK